MPTTHGQIKLRYWKAIVRTVFVASNPVAVFPDGKAQALCWEAVTFLSRPPRWSLITYNEHILEIVPALRYRKLRNFAIFLREILRIIVAVAIAIAIAIASWLVVLFLHQL